jgi:hypothetical protein
MDAQKRKTLTTAAALLASSLAAPSALAQAKVAIRFQLDWVWQGPHAFFLLAGTTRAAEMLTYRASMP